MTNVIKNTAKWTTDRGTEIKIDSTLTLKEMINADGHLVEVDCCRKSIRVELNGEYHTSENLYTVGYPRKIQGVIVLASLGEMYLTDQKDIDRVHAVIAKTESHPAWIAKKAQEQKNREDHAAASAARNSNGYCHKCGSYCYGDCEA